MILSVTLVTFISFLFIGASGLLQLQIVKAKGDWYDKVEVVVWLCPDGTSQSANCDGSAATASQITDLQKAIRDELSDDVAKTTFMSKEEFYKKYMEDAKCSYRTAQRHLARAIQDSKIEEVGYYRIKLVTMPKTT